jgi:hypothetical protein
MALTGSEKWKRGRERKRAGKIVLTIEVEAAAIRELLLDAGYLQQWNDHDRREIGRALEVALDVWARR